MKSSVDVGPDGAPLKRMSGFPSQFVEMSDALGRYEKIAASVESISRRLPPAQFPRALDICCGSGQWASAMADAGYDVIGIDASAAQVDAARRRCAVARFHVGEMAAPPQGPFDLVLNTYSSFGYGLTQEEDLNTLRAWGSTLRGGGCMVMELADLERARYVFGSSRHLVRGDGVHAPKEDLRMDWEQQLLFVDYTMGDWMWGGFTRLYSSAQLVSMLKSVGFDRVFAAGDFTGTLPKRPQDWLVLTCWKSEK